MQEAMHYFKSQAKQEFDQDPAEGELLELQTSSVSRPPSVHVICPGHL